MAEPNTNFLYGTTRPAATRSGVLRTDNGAPYKTPLSMIEEQQFQDWVRRNAIPFRDDTARSDYDMRGYWKKQQASVAPDIPRNGPFTAGTHFTDQFKTPYHETFSNESQYATPGANHWREQGPGGWKQFNPAGALVKDESQPTPLQPPQGEPPAPTTPVLGFGYKRKLEQP